ncbi:hypothetical protein CAK95_26930 [Pseudorhodoplanes sinuspersici]|uniref:Uncharacterized protein n=1 Tax=Pseudorhodoplanes sinuspersici TaxID=1235591 RepID=A0A1W6ZY64_9HYPH|nr:hypothetical protein CAK95_26930 [Pseudorhodoplanes sinuspersici]
MIYICDTYADHAADAQCCDALLISLLFIMIQLSSTLCESEDRNDDARLPLTRNDALRNRVPHL